MQSRSTQLDQNNRKKVPSRLLSGDSEIYISSVYVHKKRNNLIGKNPIKEKHALSQVSTI